MLEGEGRSFSSASPNSAVVQRRDAADADDGVPPELRAALPNVVWSREEDASCDEGRAE